MLNNNSRSSDLLPHFLDAAVLITNFNNSYYYANQILSLPCGWGLELWIMIHTYNIVYCFQAVLRSRLLTKFIIFASIFNLCSNLANLTHPHYRTQIKLFAFSTALTCSISLRCNERGHMKANKNVKINFKASTIKANILFSTCNFSCVQI